MRAELEARISVLIKTRHKASGEKILELNSYNFEKDFIYEIKRYKSKSNYLKISKSQCPKQNYFKLQITLFFKMMDHFYSLYIGLLATYLFRFQHACIFKKELN